MGRRIFLSKSKCLSVGEKNPQTPRILAGVSCNIVQDQDFHFNGKFSITMYIDPKDNFKLCTSYYPKNSDKVE